MEIRRKVLLMVDVFSPKVHFCAPSLMVHVACSPVRSSLWKNAAYISASAFPILIEEAADRRGNTGELLGKIVPNLLNRLNHLPKPTPWVYKWGTSDSCCRQGNFLAPISLSYSRTCSSPQGHEASGGRLQPGLMYQELGHLLTSSPLLLQEQLSWLFKALFLSPSDFTLSRTSVSFQDQPGLGPIVFAYSFGKFCVSCLKAVGVCNDASRSCDSPLMHHESSSTNTVGVGIIVSQSIFNLV